MLERRTAQLRKRRTREHVIADQRLNYVERFVIDEGHTVQRQEHDYGYDLSVITYDRDGYVEPGFFFVQLKAAETCGGAEWISCSIWTCAITTSGCWSWCRSSSSCSMLPGAAPIGCTYRRISAKTRLANRKKARKPCGCAFPSGKPSTAVLSRPCGDSRKSGFSV